MLGGLSDTPTISPARPPANYLAGLGLAGGFLAFVTWDQSHWWRVKEDYSFGWLVPLFTAYIVYDRWPQILARLREASAAPAPGGGVRWTLNGLAGLGLVGGALLFLLGAFYRAGAGASQPGTFAITAGMVAIVLPLIFFNVPAGEASTARLAPSSAGGRSSGGLGALLGAPRLRVTVLVR